MLSVVAAQTKLANCRHSCKRTGLGTGCADPLDATVSGGRMLARFTFASDNSLGADSGDSSNV